MYNLEKHDASAPITHGGQATPARGAFLKAGAAIGTGVALAGMVSRSAMAQVEAPVADTGCGESVQDIVNLALTAELLSTTFYYNGLTSRAVMTDRRTAGSSGNPDAIAPDGNAQNVAYLRAALDQESKHTRILRSLGATAPFDHFYFPPSAFEELGYTSHVGTFLWVLDHLETATIGAYLAAIRRFDQLGQADLAVLAMRILGVECEHRALYRVVAGDEPANNVTIEVASFNCVGDAATVLQPYLTGKGFPHGAGKPAPVPAQERITRAVGRFVSR